MLKKYILPLIVVLLFATDSFALSFNRNTKLVNLKITPEYKTVSPATETIDIIAEADIKSGWHLYWDNPGDVGDPTSLSFFESPHYIQTNEEHSSPRKSVFEKIITSYIYTQKIYFHTTFELKDIQNLQRLPFSLVLSYTACRESCQPENIPLEFALPVASSAVKNPTFLKTLINAESTFPVHLQATASLAGKQLELELQNEILKDCAEAEFVSSYPRKDALSELPRTTVADKNRLNITFGSQELPPDFKGILLCPGHAYYLDTNVSYPQTAATAYFPIEKSAQSNIFYYLLTAFIAGLILNLMPCVLPVLSLKALYLVQNRRQTSFFSAMAYMSGVLCSFLFLAGILYALRESSETLGWGFQLQSPLFNTLLFILFFLIFLNLIDCFPLPDSFADTLSRLAGKQSFLTGFFAVVVACPCTGPFMGAALGYAITQPAVAYFGIFLALGLGYALPYTLIELFPAFFLRKLPKPGRWMITLRRILALPILLTCCWLGWIIFSQLSPSAPEETLKWENYTPEKVSQALKKQQPVLIDFTAKWCLVCLLNDKTSLSTETFRKTAVEKKIRLFKADWTNHNETIGNALKKYGRNSVPLYIYYPQGKTEPVILPQLLTTGILQNLPE